VGLGH
jgi:hypothetical protein